MRRGIFVFVVLAMVQPLQAGIIDIAIDTEEAASVLAIVDAIAEETPVSEAMWERLSRSRGYEDLKYREEAMGVGFTDEEFREFVRSPDLIANRHTLRQSLAEWTRRDMDASARRALLYLPEGAEIHATVYPLVKPKRNSFVFTTAHGKAIFLFLDPEVSAAKFENTVTHELHHIGYSTVCSFDEPDDPSPRENAFRYLGALGEGYAMLAASGGAEVHPHASSPADERSVWDRHVKETSRDIKRLESFFSEIIAGTLSDESEIRRRFFELVNTDDAPQGAFYTVGWTIASAIERNRGREALVSTLCDPVGVLELYQEVAAEEGLAIWSTEFLGELGE